MITNRGKNLSPRWAPIYAHCAAMEFFVTLLVRLSTNWKLNCKTPEQNEIWNPINKIQIQIEINMNLKHDLNRCWQFWIETVTELDLQSQFISDDGTLSFGKTPSGVWSNYQKCDQKVSTCSRMLSFPHSPSFVACRALNLAARFVIAFRTCCLLAGSLVITFWSVLFETFVSLLRAWSRSCFRSRPFISK